MVTRAGRGTAAVGLALLVIGVAAGWASLVVLGVAALVALGGATWHLRRGVELSVTRSLRPSRATVGRAASSLLVIDNPTGRPLPPVTAHDQIDGELVEVEVPRLGVGTSATVELRLPTARRGIVTVGPLLVRRSDPLGLLRADRAFGTREMLWVHPRHHQVPPLPSALLRSLEGPTSDTAPQGTLTFHSLRAYERGDELRHIHWRTSARTGTLMVRKLVDTTLPDITVLLDRSAGAWTPEDFEQGIEVAASVLCACTRSRFPTRLVLSTGEVVQPSDGQLAQRFLDHLTEIDVVAADGLPLSIERLASDGRGTAVVVVTGSGDPGRLARLSTLGRRFPQVIAVIVRPGGQAPLGVRGVSVVDVPTSGSFAAAWRGATAEVGG